ncbi:hypothetical protein OAY22_00755 [Acidimicrobiia bacterium]|nr:hypothetical protein [Acidimicrobiia bacterium]
MFNKILIYLFSTIWIAGWSLFAVEEVSSTVSYLVEKHGEQISAVVKPGYVMHEKNGVKFMIKVETAAKMGVVTVEMECDSPDFWDNINYEVDLDTLEFVINFNDLNYRDFKIRNLYVITEPYSPDAADWNISTKGFEYHNFTKTHIPFEEGVTRVPLPLYKSNFNNIEMTYPLDVRLEAISMGASTSVTCVKDQLLRIPVENFKDFNNMDPFFADGILEPYDIESLNVQPIEEDAFIENFMEYQELRQSGKDLPSFEAALALLGKDLIYAPHANGDFKWEDEAVSNKRLRNEKTVLGLYGNILKSDLEDLKKVIEVLHVVAPGLDISYSTETKDVTMPIHITHCKDKLAKHIGCKDQGFAGVYMGWKDYVWVDGSLRGDYRSHVIIHEIGHALGLGHNLCWTSAMTYEFSGPKVPYLSHIDLIQLQILYHPDLEPSYDYKRSKRTLNRDYIINKLGLSEERVAYYEENIEEACYQKPGAYDYLIELQNNGGKSQ